MIKQYFNCAIVIFSALAVYAFCQEETLLPVAAGVVLVVSLLARLTTGEKHYAAIERIPWSVIIIASLIAGFLWRSLFPAPQEANSPFPAFTAALQSATILATLFIWLKPLSEKNLHYLLFLAWGTSASSIDVPLTQERLVVFSSFCVIATVFVIPQTLRKPKNKEHTSRHYRDFILFSGLLIFFTVGLFFGIAKSLVAFDEAFMNLASDYLMPRGYTNFLRINPKLDLTNPGRSAWDKRPVMQVTLPQSPQGDYLKMQIFKNFHNGTWDEIENPPQTPLPKELDRILPKAKLMMFAAFEKIIPSVYGITAAAVAEPLSQSREGILYSKNRQNTRILELSVDEYKKPYVLSQDEWAQYTQVPPEIAEELKNIADSIIGEETNPALQARLIENFFRRNFKYSLSVNFRADNEGLIKMIKERRPAYCSYFATAVTLLLRSEGIPARVTTGFHASEKINPRDNTYLVRVYDAHAWSEALLPQTSQETAQQYFTWKRFDATPPGERVAALKDLGINISKILDRLWLGSLRLGAYLENLDKEKLKKNLLLTLVLVMLYLNRRSIASGLREWMKNRKKKSFSTLSKNDPLFSLYRRYESYLKSAFHEVRQTSDTDMEVLQRLKARGDLKQETLLKMENFIYYYHAARFGGKKDRDLTDLLEDIGKGDIR